MVEDALTVDALKVENNEIVVLSVFDHLDWEDEGRHLFALQGKLNSYFDFIQSGQIVEKFSVAKGLPVRIDIFTQFAMPDIGERFVSQANMAARQLNGSVTWKQVPGDIE